MLRAWYDPFEVSWEERASEYVLDLSYILNGTPEAERPPLPHDFRREIADYLAERHFCRFDSYKEVPDWMNDMLNESLAEEEGWGWADAA